MLPVVKTDSDVTNSPGAPQALTKSVDVPGLGRAPKNPLSLPAHGRPPIHIPFKPLSCRRLPTGPITSPLAPKSVFKHLTPLSKLFF